MVTGRDIINKLISSRTNTSSKASTINPERLKPSDPYAKYGGAIKPISPSYVKPKEPLVTEPKPINPEKLTVTDPYEGTGIKPISSSYKPPEPPSLLVAGEIIKARAGKQVRDIKTGMESIDVNEKYVLQSERNIKYGAGQIVSGKQLKKMYEADYEKAVEQQEVVKSDVEKFKLYDPDTKVVITPTGYNISFPYEGAEKYSDYKKIMEKDPFTAYFVSAVSPENPLLIGSTMEAIFGDKRKAEQKVFQSLYAGEKAVSSWATSKPTVEGFLGFGKRVFLDNPVNQIITMRYGGKFVRSAGAFAKGATIVKYGTSAGKLITAGKIASFSVGAGVIGYQAYDIGKTFASGKTAEGATKLTLFGIYAGAGLSGYMSGGKAGATAWESAGKAWMAQRRGSPYYMDVLWGRTGTWVGTVSDIKAFQSRGVPFEVGRYRIGELSFYKMGSPRDVYITFPGSKPPSVFSGFRTSMAYPRAVESYLKTTPEGTEYIANRVLFGGGRLSFFKGTFGYKKYGIGMRWAEVETFAQKGILETSGFGGIATTKHVTVPISVLSGVPKNIFMPSASVISPIALPIASGSLIGGTKVVEIKKPKTGIRYTELFFGTQREREKIIGFKSELASRRGVASVLGLSYAVTPSVKPMDVVDFMQGTKSRQKQAVTFIQDTAYKRAYATVVAQDLTQRKASRYVPFFPVFPQSVQGRGSLLGGKRRGKGYRYLFREFRVDPLSKYSLFGESKKIKKEEVKNMSGFKWKHKGRMMSENQFYRSNLHFYSERPYSEYKSAYRQRYGKKKKRR